MVSLGATVTSDFKEAIKDADVVMGLRIQFERQKNMPFPNVREYSSLFGVNSDILKYAKEDVLVMHPGPVNRGVEFDTDVIDGKHSVINVQVKNGVAVRMAILKLLTDANHKK
jgi:aspartate carbamoyltransferase catalytic subunit